MAQSLPSPILATCAHKSSSILGSLSNLIAAIVSFRKIVAPIGANILGSWRCEEASPACSWSFRQPPSVGIFHMTYISNPSGVRHRHNDWMSTPVCNARAAFQHPLVCRRPLSKDTPKLPNPNLASRPADCEHRFDLINVLTLSPLSALRLLRVPISMPEHVCRSCV